MGKEEEDEGVRLKGGKGRGKDVGEKGCIGMWGQRETVKKRRNEKGSKMKRGRR